jgi:hypothetical protein
MKRLLSFLFILVLTISALTITPSAAKTHTESISILNADRNLSGDGYEWHNPSDTLTLTNLRVDTQDEYGLKVPAYQKSGHPRKLVTIILNGDNYIKASKAALFLECNVLIRGNGSLTLVGDEYGILCNSAKVEHKLTLSDGTFIVSGGVDGIHSEFQKVTVSGADLTVSSENGYAINARDLQTGYNARIKATGSFHTSYSMLLQASDLSIESKEAALITGKYMELDSMTLKAGDSLSSLSDIDSYSGEKAILTVSTFDDSPKSILFGEKYPLALDIVLLVAVILVLGIVVVLPILIKKKKAKAAVLQRDAEEAERKKRKKEEKKSAAKN